MGASAICFSATASFTAGAALLAIGAVTVRRAATSTELPFALIPVIFGVQQLVEGGLWLGLLAGGATTHGLTVAYLLIANVIWPIFVPIAVALIEPFGSPRWKILLPVIAGVATGLFYLIALVSHPVWAEIMGAHVKYHFPHGYRTLAFAGYFIATCLAPLMSSHRMVRIFGAVLIGSSIVARLIYETWFASVWCYFAALASCIVYLQFATRRQVATH